MIDTEIYDVELKERSRCFFCIKPTTHAFSAYCGSIRKRGEESPRITVACCCACREVLESRFKLREGFSKVKEDMDE